MATMPKAQWAQKRELSRIISYAESSSPYQPIIIVCDGDARAADMSHFITARPNETHEPVDRL
eukprot:1814133-Heterocapsa_arctica.AAC.1